MPAFNIELLFVWFFWYWRDIISLAAASDFHINIDACFRTFESNYEKVQESRQKYGYLTAPLSLVYYSSCQGLLLISTQLVGYRIESHSLLSAEVSISWGMLYNVFEKIMLQWHYVHLFFKLYRLSSLSCTYPTILYKQIGTNNYYHN